MSNARAIPQSAELPGQPPRRTDRLRRGRRFDPPQPVARFMRELEQHDRAELKASAAAPWAAGAMRH